MSSGTWPFDTPGSVLCRSGIVNESVSPTVVEIMGPKYIAVMTLTCQDHVTS